MDMVAVRADLIDVILDGGYHAYPTFHEAMKLPAIVVGQIDSVQYARTLSSLTEIDLTVTAYVQLNDFDAAQRQIDTFVSTAYTDTFRVRRNSWKACQVVEAGNVRDTDDGKYRLVDLSLHFVA